MHSPPFLLHRDVLRVGAAALCGASLAWPLHAQPAYPNRPLRLVLPNTPGSSVDAMARQLAVPLAVGLGQPVVIENIAGSGGVIGVQQMVRAPRDGHTLCIVSNSYTISPFLYKLPYDPVKDVAPVAILSGGPLVLTVHQKLPVKTLPELLALARTRTGKDSLTYGSAGVGSVPHMAGAQMAATAQAEFLHVPYKGMNTYTTDLIAGQIDIGFMPSAVAVPMVKSGNLRAIAVTTTRRAPAFPELPTLAEAGLPGYELSGWLAVIAGAGTPAAIVQRLNTELVRAMHAPELTRFAEEQGTQIIASSAEDAARWFARDLEVYGRLAHRIGMKVEN